MALASCCLYMSPLIPSRNPPRELVISYSQTFFSRNPRPFLHNSPSSTSKPTPTTAEAKRCLRCGALYAEEDNSPTACGFHGHTTGANMQVRGLFSLSPPHQGIEGEWTYKSGVIVYRWNDREKRPDTGISNWKRRWSCCSEYEEQAPPCCRGYHVSYDDGFTLF